jgi:predicted  nucleic acid-binding Zn-ribbon protein
MFECERCGSSYSARHTATMGDCPRCQGRDKIASPLVFKPFSRAQPRRAPSTEAVRSEMRQGEPAA